MKDLDKTQVYDLIGITEEQAKELCEWLNYDVKGWGEWGWFIEDGCLEYSYPNWFISGSKPTTHISTLFEQSYEEKLQEAKEKLDHYKKEVERLEDGSKPKLNDVCKFWDDYEGDFVIGVIEGIDGSNYPYLTGGPGSVSFKNAKKLTEQEVIDILFKKS